MNDGRTMKSVACARERLTVTCTVLPHGKLLESMNVLIHVLTLGRRCKPSPSVLMHTGGPLKKLQTYSQPITFSLMMLCPICSSWPGNSTCGSKSTFLEVPEMQTWHGPACRQRHVGI